MKSILFNIMTILLLFTINLSSDDIVSREGDIVTIVSSGEYFMGDSDNKINARNLALAQAKINASEIAGTYIESSFKMTTLNNSDEVNKLTSKEIYSFTSAILKTQIKDEKIELSTNQSMVYKVTIEATVDVSILHKRIIELANDKARKDDLLRLENENKILMESLNKLNLQLKTLESSKQMSSSDIKALQSQREEVVSKIIKNENSAGVIVNGIILVNEFENKKQYADDLLKRISLLIARDIDSFYLIQFDEPKILDEKNEEYEVKISGKLLFLEDKLIEVIQNSFRNDFKYNKYDKSLLYIGEQNINDLISKRLASKRYQTFFTVGTEQNRFTIGYSNFSPLKKIDFSPKIFNVSSNGYFEAKIKILKTEFNSKFTISGKVQVRRVNID